MSRFVSLLAAATALAAAAPATAGIVLSEAVVDIEPGQPAAQDIEVWNNGSDVAYVVSEPSEIRSPGLPAEARVKVEDPGAGGLLVTPQRLILQAGERKLVRIATIAPRGASDRVWRVTIKPVAGQVTAPGTALKLLVGYDVLVIQRPAVITPQVTASHAGAALTLVNAGNTNVELYEGKQCAADGPDCKPLPSRRLYPGQSWTQTLPGNGPARYRMAAGHTVSQQSY
jgi:P pilus assembly chaperone PapD